jgi:DNA-binding transcriptional MerR regulator
MSTLTIGKLAKACAVKVDTIRYYERKGLLLPSARTESDYRVYLPDSVRRLQFIRKAKGLGFTLEEIKGLLEISERPEADCGDVREHARTKIMDIDERITDLIKIKTCLEGLASFCPGEGKPLAECNILQYFYGDES